MKKNLRFLLVAALATMFSTAAMAQDEQNDAAAAAPRVSANGSYQFKPSWGIGLQYGMTFTDLQNWNDYLLVPGHMNYFDVNWLNLRRLRVSDSAFLVAGRIFTSRIPDLTMPMAVWNQLSAFAVHSLSLQLVPA